MIVNLTPHSITVQMYMPMHDIIIPPTAPAARLKVTAERAESVDDIPATRQVFGAVENLPDPAPGVTYVTSTQVAQRVARADVVSPDTGPTAIRNGGGQIIAVRGFQRFS